MHYLMLITLFMPEGATSSDARQEAYDRLLTDNSFCGEGGRFGSPLCDWFVIGGRWSGSLTEAKLGDAYRTALESEFPQLTNGYFPSSLVETHKIRLDQLWQQCGGSGMNPLTRSNYDELGSDDDAMVVDRFLYDRFLCQHAGESNNHGCFSDLDGDQVNESFVGLKWLFVVDCHN